MIRLNEDDFKKRIKNNETLNNILNELMEELGLSEEEALDMMLLAYYDRLRSVGVNVVRRGEQMSEKLYKFIDFCLSLLILTLLMMILSFVSSQLWQSIRML